MTSASNRNGAGARAPLSLWYRDYAAGNLAKSGLEALAFRHLAANRRYFCPFVCGQDRWLDCLSWLYPRMSRAIAQYAERGAGFGAYFSSVVRWGAKEFFLSERFRSFTERAYWETRAGEMEARSAEPEYLTDDSPPPKERRAARVLPRRGLPGRTRGRGTPGGALERCLKVPGISGFQALVLLLKSYLFVSEDFLRRVAGEAGLDSGEVLRLMDEIRALRRKRDDSLNRLREAVHLQFYRCLVFQRRLACASPGDAGYRFLKERCGRARTRLESIKERLKRKGKSATNAEIAAALGVTKGVVGGALHAARRLAEQREQGREEG
ncbi:MAG: hypothetical protein MdMp014T_0281 [Treponematales bacterium]